MADDEKKPKFKIDLSDIGERYDMGELNKEAMDAAVRKAAESMADGLLFGGPPRHSGRSAGGNIFGDVMGGPLFDPGPRERGPGARRRPPYEIGSEDQQESVVRLLWEKAMLVWDYPVDWQMGVTYNPGQQTWWFTAQYWDDESSTALVKETIEFTAEYAYDMWEELDVAVERQLTDMREKCLADLAAFE